MRVIRKEGTHCHNFKGQLNKTMNVCLTSTDANTDRGSSGASSTFNNDPLTTSEEFQVKDLECWAVSSQVAEQLGVDTRRDFCGEDHLIPCTPAFLRWKMMEDCR